MLLLDDLQLEMDGKKEQRKHEKEVKNKANNMLVMAAERMQRQGIELSKKRDSRREKQRMWRWSVRRVYEANINEMK